MTIATARAICSDLGLTLRHTDGEFRVNWKGAHEDIAYYTDDLDDAVGTARAMAAEEADQAAECAAGTCGHYTCTEGGSLGYWEGADPRLEGNF